jgi:hypothetical protein
MGLWVNRWNRDTRGLIIRGNFSPTRQSRFYRAVSILLGGCMAVALLVALTIYGLTVQYEIGLNDMGKATREMNETNKELLVRLNRLQSFENIEASATKLPDLHASDEVIALETQKIQPLPNPPKRTGELPRVYGY